MSVASLDSTTSLLGRMRDGDRAARDQLVARCLPALRRWAHGRLPVAQRDLAETDDLVQTTVLRAINNLDGFEAETPGALFGYLRQIALNLIRDQHRAHVRRPQRLPLDPALADSGASVLDQAIGAEAVAAYEHALDILDQGQRNAVILRMEFGFSYAEIALELALPSSDAARMVVSRALVRLAREMR